MDSTDGADDLSKLNDSQREILNSVLNDDSNTFITGPAGTGKSFLIHCIARGLKNQRRKNVVLTAPTGVAASNLTVKGVPCVTIHSFAGIPVGGYTPESHLKKVRTTRGCIRRLKSTDVLIIDEISMVGAKTLEAVDYITRKIRKPDSIHPFGRMRLIVIGDFYQLGPINDSFCFKSESWKSIITTHELRTIVRQDDHKFIQFLNMIRVGDTSDETLSIVSDCLIDADHEIKGDDQEDIEHTVLYATNDSKDKLNNDKLDKLPGEARVFTARFLSNSKDKRSITAFMDNAEKNYPCVKRELKLKVGAQVMLTKNIDITSGLVNGSRGVVTGFKSRTGNPIVKFTRGVVTEVTEASWEREEGGGGGGVDSDNNNNNTIFYKMYQIPLILAWSLTIHKIQGCTLDKVRINLSRVRSHGQAYVALGRSRTLSGLKVDKPFSKDNIVVDNEVRVFYDGIAKKRRRVDDGSDTDKITCKKYSITWRNTSGGDYLPLVNRNDVITISDDN